MGYRIKGTHARVGDAPASIWWETQQLAPRKEAEYEGGKGGDRVEPFPSSSIRTVLI